jgi:glutathione peroxidase-family protein
MVYFHKSQLTHTYGDDMSDIYNLEMNAITGESVSFSDYRDQAMLMVNLASQ